MSIKNEINRLQSAKQDIKNAIEKRGVIVEDSLKLDSFANVLGTAPYAVCGTFTPEEDTQVFSVNGLPFSVDNVYIVCGDLSINSVVDAIYMVVHAKGDRGAAVHWSENGRALNGISENSTLSEYREDGYTFDASKSQGMSNDVFKAGYTYNYYIGGGLS